MLGPVRARRMFGGWGLYAQELFVALIANERLYLKADDTTRPSFEAAGSRQFFYEARGQATTMGYWTVPDEALDAQPLFAPWARLALQAAVAARALRPAPTGRASSRRTPRARAR